LGAFSKNDVYRVLGFYINYVAGLEFSVDKFLFTAVTAVEDKRFLGQFKNFPIDMPAKIDAIVLAYVLHPPLRSCGDADDYISLNGIAYGLEEVWSARNTLVHGIIFYSRRTEGSFYIKSQRHQRIGRNRYSVVESKIGLGAIISRLERARYINAILKEGIRILEGEDVRKLQQIMRRERARGRELVAELEACGFSVDYSGGFLKRETE